MNTRHTPFLFSKKERLKKMCGVSALKKKMLGTPNESIKMKIIQKNYNNNVQVHIQPVDFRKF
jgi:hypothetical protein